MDDVDHLPLGGEPDRRYQRLKLHNRVHTWLIVVWSAALFLTDWFNYAEYETRGCFVMVVAYSFFALYYARWEWGRIKELWHSNASEHFLGLLSGSRVEGRA